MNTLEPISDAPSDTWRSLRFLFTDIDDTLTTDGMLRADAYGMLEKLHDAGIVVIPVTGRPAGWCDMITRFWPVGAIVGENGAFYFHYEQCTRRMTRQFAQSATQRASNRSRLKDVQAEVLRMVPGAAIASDQAYREADLAIDFCEDVARLCDDDINRIVGIFEASGATAKVSSIHVNGWFGSHDKLTMTRQLMHQEFDCEIATPKGQQACAFIGDSPNDAPMFGFFKNSIGVSNIADLAGRCEALPKWITEGASGAGFCELAQHILAARETST